MKNLLRFFYIGSGVCFTIAATSINAALPPLYESLVEYKSLLSSRELVDKFGSTEGILDIKRTDKGFVITGYKNTLLIDLVYDPQEHPGPAKFHFVFHDLQSN